jgi:hypothetical protein
LARAAVLFIIYMKQQTLAMAADQNASTSSVPQADPKRDVFLATMEQHRPLGRAV